MVQFQIWETISVGDPNQQIYYYALATRCDRA